MGNEATCRATIDGEEARGKVLLETHEIVFRSPEKRAVIPLASITKVTAREGLLIVLHARGEAAFEIGSAAPKWADKIRVPKPRIDKLGVKSGMRVALLGVTDDAFADELRARCERVTNRMSGEANLVFVPIDDARDLAKLPTVRKAMADDAALWVIRPKGAATISEAQVRAAGIGAGLVDVKVVAFSATHTAEKFVVPVAKRAMRQT
jgi:hypothetical protein